MGAAADHTSRERNCCSTLLRYRNASRVDYDWEPSPIAWTPALAMAGSAISYFGLDRFQ